MNSGLTAAEVAANTAALQAMLGQRGALERPTGDATEHAADPQLQAPVGLAGDPTLQDDALRAAGPEPLQRSLTYPMDQLRNVDPKQQICFDFTKGVCNRGDACKYSHDIHLIVTINSQERGICFDFLKGQCHRGLLCRFSHDLSNIAAHQKQYGTKTARKNAPICYDFVKGQCVRGAACRYSHDLTSIINGTKNATEVCHDYLRGRCHRGALCRYSHDIQAAVANAPWNAAALQGAAGMPGGAPMMPVGGGLPLPPGGLSPEQINDLLLKQLGAASGAAQAVHAAAAAAQLASAGGNANRLVPGMGVMPKQAEAPTAPNAAAFSQFAAAQAAELQNKAQYTHLLNALQQMQLQRHQVAMQEREMAAAAAASLGASPREGAMHHPDARCPADPAQPRCAGDAQSAGASCSSGSDFTIPAQYFSNGDKDAGGSNVLLPTSCNVENVLQGLNPGGGLRELSALRKAASLNSALTPEFVTAENLEPPSAAATASQLAQLQQQWQNAAAQQLAGKAEAIDAAQLQGGELCGGGGADALLSQLKGIWDR